jgi:uncharacterized protein (DUF983 family)
MTQSSQTSAFRAGLLQRCPACSKGKLYRGLLAVTDQCSACGLNLQARDPGDGPAFFVITFFGFVVVALAVWFEFAFTPPLWAHAALWIPFVSLGSILLLRITKALLIAYQYKLKIGFIHD